MEQTVQRMIQSLLFAAVLGATVLVDKQTGVNYLYANSGYGGGLTVMVDALGNPIVTPITEE